jgi:glycosyltransferase involved in cell wall biosynthesis
MRVTLLSKALVVGAYQRKCELLAEQVGLELTVIVPPAWGDAPLERAHTSGYALRPLPIRLNGNFHLHHYAGLRRALAEQPPDLFHIDEEPYNLATYLAMRAAPARAKIVFFSWQNLLRRYPPPFRWMEAAIFKRANAAIAGNAEVKDVLRAKGYAGPVYVIPQFGVDEARFRPAGTPRPARPFTVGYAGRLVAEKDVALLVQALAGLGGDARLLIVGDGPERAALRAQAEQAGLAQRVEFRPNQPSTRMPEAFAEMDALALPSRTQANWKEQFGRVLIEAMASGVPVVGSSSGEIPNVIGEAGLVFPERDAAALGAAIARLRDSAELRADLAARGRERVLAQFSMRRIAEATAAAYREIIATP